MNKFTEIKEGWKNLIFPTPEVEKIAFERLDICITCINNPDKQNIDLFTRCKKCGCVLEAKVRSLKSQCPDELWKSMEI